MDKQASPGISESAENPLDWRRWVPKEVRRDVLSFMTRAFILGAVVGILCGCLYWRYSVSKEKIFQGAIIVAALAFTMPAFATSLKLMLSMFYMGYAGNEKSEGAFKSITALKDEAQPILQNVSVIVHKMAAMAERNGSGDMVKSLVAELKAAIPPDLEARFNRMLVAIEAIAAPPTPKKPGLLERGIPKAPAPEVKSLESLSEPCDLRKKLESVPTPAIEAIAAPKAPAPDDETRILPMPFVPVSDDTPEDLDIRRSGILPKPTMPVGISPIAT